MTPTTLQTLRKKLLNNWHLARAIRLILGLTLLVQALETFEITYGIIAGLLLYQVYSNTGCGGKSSCQLPPDKNE